MPDSRVRAESVASRSSVETTTSQSSAALLGATTAFRSASYSRQRPPPISLTSHENGALAAASLASSGGRSPLRNPSRSPLAKAGSPARDGGSEPVKQRRELAVPYLQSQRNQSRSPSQQAAMLATSTTNAAPPSAEPKAPKLKRQGKATRPRVGTSEDRPAVAPKPRRLSQHHLPKSLDTTLPEKPTDASSIAPTTSLVQLFEQKLKDSQSADQQDKRPEPIIVKPTSDLSIRSPKPLRSGITSMLQLELGQDRGREATDKPYQQADSNNEALHKTAPEDAESSEEGFASAAEDLRFKSPLRSPPSVRPRSNANNSGQQKRQAPLAENEAKRQPAISPAKSHSTTQPIQINLPHQSAATQSEAMSLSSSQSLRSIPAQYHLAHPKRSTPLTKGDELANALVASSLASSRAPSPSKLEPPALPPKKKGHHHHLSFSRTPSPAKAGMRHTLRKADDSSSDSEEELHPYGKHKKKRLVRKHPNKHHEGDRKRWRDAVTERERKRYEGVWAANKGIYCSLTDEEHDSFQRSANHERMLEVKAQANEQVSNMVARDIWNRSRLPESILEAVWDLVDSEEVGRLHKEEFVVGMWLIDQRLKGRKLPVKVTETVWASVRGIQGIKVKKK